MGNKIREALAPNVPAVALKVQFESTEDRQAFLTALEQTYGTGDNLELKRIRGRIDSSIRCGDGSYRGPSLELSKAIISPNKKTIKIPIDRADGQELIPFEYTKLRNRVIFEMGKDEATELKFTIEGIDGQQVMPA